MKPNVKPKSGQTDRQTETEIARSKLGGVKGSHQLQPAPMTKREREQLLPNDDDGHPA